MERRVLLKERKLHLRKARIKHLTLQKELRESLAKSRERLARLTTLEQLDRESQDGSASCEISAFSDDPLSLETRMEIESRVEIIDVDFESETIPEVSAQEDSTDDLKNPALANSPLHSFKTLQEFNQKHSHLRSLMNFLPTINHKTMRRILLLSMREANSLGTSRGTPQRRCLLWNTCLDLAMLSHQTRSESTSQDSMDNIDQNDDASSFLDPHVSLCPYELAGVCADEFCHYQHTTKETLPREEIPLPALALQTKQATGDSKAKDSKVSADDGERRSLLKSISAASGGDDSGKSEQAEDDDFLLLPPAEVGDEIEESSSDADSDDDAHGGALSLANALIMDHDSSSFNFAFVWGGRIYASDDSLDQALTHLQGMAIKSAPLLSAVVDLSSDHSVSSLAFAVEATRLAIHAGRFDLVEQLPVLAKSSFPELYSGISERLKYIARHSFVYQAIEYSFIRTAFEGQSALAIISTLLESAIDASTQVLVDHSLIEMVSSQCISMWSFGGLWSLEEEFTISDFRNVLNGTHENGMYHTNGVRTRLTDLFTSLNWVQRRFGPRADYLRSLHLIDSNILKPCWAAVQRWIRLLKEEEFRWGGVKAVILMGNIVLGCLERFASYVQSDSLNSSITAALITVDTTIWQILKGLSKQLSRVPMIDVLLAPLFAANVTTATFLRHYSTAYHRLEGLLALAPNRVDRPVLTKFSELLWSQFFHLRMALRVESVQETPTNDDDRKARSKGFPWEPSPNATRDNEALLDRVELLGIRLHHVTLEGDRVLAHAMSNSNFSSATQMHSARAQALQEVGHHVLQSVALGHDQEEVAGSTCNNGLSTLQVKGTRFDPVLDNSSPTPSSNISSFPRSLLLTGHTLQFLSLSQCNLTLLPASLGLYFPNLVVRRSDAPQLLASERRHARNSRGWDQTGGVHPRLTLCFFLLPLLSLSLFLFHDRSLVPLSLASDSRPFKESDRATTIVFSMYAPLGTAHTIPELSLEHIRRRIYSLTHMFGCFSQLFDHPRLFCRMFGTSMFSTRDVESFLQ